MKADIHPSVRPVVFHDTVSGARFRILSSVKASETVTIDGTEYPMVKVDVSSASHPFYTGTQRIMDTAGRVERFGTRYGNKASSTLTSLIKKTAGGGAAADDKNKK